MTAREQKLAEIAKYGKTMREWYREVYLYSGHWMQLRLRKLVHAGRKCERCGIGGNLDIHHKNYREIYDVEMGDLEALCRTCHKLEHHIKAAPSKPKIFKKQKRRRDSYKSSPAWKSLKRAIRAERRELVERSKKSKSKQERKRIKARIKELCRELELKRRKIMKQCRSSPPEAKL